MKARLVTETVVTILLVGMSTLSIIQPSYAGVIFFDSFNDGDADGWIEHLGAWGVIDGEYFMTTLGDRNGISTVNYLTLTDCSIETKLRFADTEVGFRAGVIFRWNHSGHYYAFELSNEYDGTSLFYYNPDAPRYGYRVGARGNYTVHANVDYALKVEVKGNTFKGYINGVEVVSGTDGTLTNGKVGLRGRRADTFFDNFMVQSLPSPPVGGKADPMVISVNNLGLLAPYIRLAILVTVFIVTIVHVTKRRQ